MARDAMSTEMRACSGFDSHSARADSGSELVSMSSRQSSWSSTSHGLTAAVYISAARLWRECSSGSALQALAGRHATRAWVRVCVALSTSVAAAAAACRSAPALDSSTRRAQDHSPSVWRRNSDAAGHSAMR